MISVDEAIGTLLKACPLQVSTERERLLEASGRVLATDVVAPIDVPPADNSAMDGYAFRYEDWQGADHPIPLSQRITAGAVPAALDARWREHDTWGWGLPPSPCHLAPICALFLIRQTMAQEIK